MDAESFLADRRDEGAVDEGEARLVGEPGLGKNRLAGHRHTVETGHFHDLPLRLPELAVDRLLDEVMHVPPNLCRPRRARRRTDQLKEQRMASDGPACVRETLAARFPG